MKSSPVRLVLRRELQAHFSSPVAYIAAALFLLLTGGLFISPFFLRNRADMGDFFSLMPLTLAVLLPALTMGLYAGEKSSGHEEILNTLPVSPGQILWGKYLASLIFLLSLLLPTLFYPAFIDAMGDLDWGPVWGGYMGTLLLGGSYSALGLLCSSLTKRQISAFLISSAVCLFLALADEMALFLPQGIRRSVASIGTDNHFRGFIGGVVDFRDLAYFFSVTAICLLLLREVQNERS